VEEFDVKQTLDDAVSKLPEIQRHVVLLRDYEGYSYAEIGEITQLNEQQVKVYIFRARQKLRSLLTDPELIL
jgi:RNA polymerase sigma-70 factor (ECF subfamily)